MGFTENNHPYIRFDDEPPNTRPSEELQHIELNEYEKVASGENDGHHGNGADSLPRMVPPRDEAFTWRAVIVGSFLGGIIAASNMYLGLQVGWTFGASLFGAIVGFAILKPLSTMLPKAFGGGYFGPKENCTVQSAATAAGGLSVGFVSAIPALYRLELLSPQVTSDFIPLLLWSLAAAYYGLFFAIPLRRYFILKQKLIFPSPSVAAQTIKSLHDTSEGEMSGKAKAKVLLIAFVIAFILKCLVWWLPVLIEWHVLYWLGRATNSFALMAADQIWKWRLELGLAFLGAGMLIGTNTAASYLTGSVMSWAVVGPILLATGTVSNSFGFPTINGREEINPEEFRRQISAQYFLLWPGVTIMIVSSFAELGVRWRTLVRGFAGLFQQTKSLVRKKGAGSDSTLVGASGQGQGGKVSTIDGEEEEDPALPHEQVPFLWWSVGLLVSTLFTIIVLTVLFKVAIYESFMAILLGFLLAFVGVQASGETDINPTGSIGKVSQFVFAAFWKPDKVSMLRTNLIAGDVAAACAAQTVDMVGDLRTGHLLRASPRSQFLAQACGSLLAVFLSTGLFMLFGTSYPCFLRILKPGETCQFQAPAVASWTAVSVALTSGIDKTVPVGSAWISLGAAIFCILYTVAKYRFVPLKYRGYLLSLNALGIAMVNPQPYIGLTMMIGSLIDTIWKRRFPQTHEMLMFAVASGLIAGEGIGGIVEAIYALAGL
ncbi:hypothetical protein HK102_001025, partial [Quaeritorhiza haematococci]